MYHLPLRVPGRRARVDDEGIARGAGEKGPAWPGAALLPGGGGPRRKRAPPCDGQLHGRRRAGAQTGAGDHARTRVGRKTDLSLNRHLLGLASRGGAEVTEQNSGKAHGYLKKGQGPREAAKSPQADRGAGVRRAAVGGRGGLLRGRPHADLQLHSCLREGGLVGLEGPHGSLRQGGTRGRDEGRGEDTRAPGVLELLSSWIKDGRGPLSAVPDRKELS